MFSNRSGIDVLSFPKVPRKFLILIRAGSNPRQIFFNNPPPSIRSYDVGVNYYAPPHIDDVMFRSGDLVCAGGLSKLHGAKLLIEASDIMSLYDGVLFLDDDLELLFDPTILFRLSRV